MEDQIPLRPRPANTVDRYAAWLVASTLATAAISWTAFQAQQEGLAPAVVFPLTVGAVLGGLTSAISRIVMAPGRRTAIAAAVCWGLLAVVGQDYIGHRRHLRVFDGELQRQSPLVAAALVEDRELRPTFSQYLDGRVRSRPGWWGLELLLTAGAVVAMTACNPVRQPFPKSNVSQDPS